MFSYILFYKKNYLKIILFSVFISLITYSFSYGDSNILSSEEIVEDAKIVMNKAEKERWPILKKSIKNKNFQTLMHLSNWIYFQKNTQKINFEDLKNYYEEYKSWPASNNILLAIEKKIDWYDKDQKKTLLWMDNITPISVLGKIKVADKMIANIAQDDPQQYRAQRPHLHLLHSKMVLEELDILPLASLKDFFLQKECTPVRSQTMHLHQYVFLRQILGVPCYWSYVYYHPHSSPRT